MATFRSQARKGNTQIPMYNNSEKQLHQTKENKHPNEIETS